MAQRARPGGGPILIRKYVNRRLYDTSASRYVTLEEVAARVAGGESVRVEDARSHADITAQVLTQAIFEGESESGPGRVLNRQALEALLRLQKAPLRKSLARRVASALTAIADGVAGRDRTAAAAERKTAPMRFQPLATPGQAARLSARIDALQARLGRLIAEGRRDDG